MFLFFIGVSIGQITAQTYSINLSWIKRSDYTSQDPGTVNVYRMANVTCPIFTLYTTIGFDLIVTGQYPEGSYLDKDVQPGTTYCYLVTELRDGAESVPSNSLYITTPFNSNPRWFPYHDHHSYHDNHF